MILVKLIKSRTGFAKLYGLIKDSSIMIEHLLNYFLKHHMN